MEKTVAALRKDICEKDSQIKTLQQSLNEMGELAERKDEIIGDLKDKLETCEVQLQDQAKGSERELKALQKELYYLNEICAQNRKGAESTITSLFQEVTEKRKQIEKLKKKNAHEAKQLKDENAELHECTDALRKECAKLQVCIGSSKKEKTDLREHIDCLKRENEKLNGVKGDLKRQIQNKAAYADTLKIQVRELQQVVQSQKEELKRLTKMGKQERDSLKSKLTEVQAVVQSQKRLKKATDQAQYERDSLKITVTELEKVIQAQKDEIEQRATRLKEQSSQTVDDPHDGDGSAMLGAAGVALGVAGITGIILSRLSN
jgi:chromosome segregation ATPase